VYLPANATADAQVTSVSRMCAAVSAQGSNIGAQGLPQLAAVVTSSIELAFSITGTVTRAEVM